MKWFKWILLIVSSICSLQCFATPVAGSSIHNNPLAKPEAVVLEGNARFTVLTSQLIRMEWSADAIFEDRATLGIVNRDLTVPEYKVYHRRNKLIIKTDDLTLTYSATKDESGHLTFSRFTKDNLKVEFLMNSTKVLWYPGKDDSGNLQGTVRTLDGFDGVNTSEPYDPGVISRDGWAILDETDRHILVPEDSDWGEWVAERPSSDHQDLYIFAYGHEYKKALQAFTSVAGKIPLPPKYAFGYWWSRYWQYSDFEFRDLGQKIRSLDIPIDVMIVDMDWHETWSLRKYNAPRDEFGERIGWSGYTWKKELFPNPSNFLQDLHDMGMKTALNLHPASGIQPYEDCYDRFVADYLDRTDKAGVEYDGPQSYLSEDGQKVPVPFRISDRQWTDAYFNSVIHPLEDMGVDFWWLDWQQWRLSKYMKDLNITFWLNYTFFNDKVRQTVSEGIYAERPMIYHRWGGIGSHRYQIGFSGDTYATWNVLKGLPYFTSTASNVGYGYWGHDIGGHTHKDTYKTEPEMLTRWLQYGVFTPIFKTHCTKHVEMERRIWMFPEYFDAMRDAIRLRYDLSPYIYAAARQAYDSSICICRPMYYDYPEEPNAYSWKEQNMFGDDILTTVLCEPVDSTTGLTPRSMWFPEGNDWYDAATGKMYEGGTCADLQYTLMENPYYIKAGSVIPMASHKIQSLQEQDNNIVLFVTPGDGIDTISLYEDDGSTQAYDTEFATTEVVKTSADAQIVLNVMPKKGSYRNMPLTRQITAILASSPVPEHVYLNGDEIPYTRFPSHEKAAGKAAWTYDGRELAVKILLPETSVKNQENIVCTFSQESWNFRPQIYGIKGVIKRMEKITADVKYAFGKCVDRYQMLPSDFLKVAQLGSAITERPDMLIQYIQSVDLQQMYEVFASINGFPEDLITCLKHQVDL